MRPSSCCPSRRPLVVPTLILACLACSPVEPEGYAPRAHAQAGTRLTAEQPFLVRDIHQGKAPAFSSDPTWLTRSGGYVYFSASDGSSGTELWRTDGTAEGTRLVRDIQPGPWGSLPEQLADVRGTLYFTADDGAFGRQLWRSDGTEAGTVRVSTGLVTGGLNPLTTNLTEMNGLLYFATGAGTSADSPDVELWRSDGTEAGTYRVADLWPGWQSSAPTNLRAIDGTLYFSADDGLVGYELWKSNGSAAGTVRLKDLRPGSVFDHGNPSDFTQLGSGAFFLAQGSSGRRIWRTDGTSAGTRLVTDDASLVNALWLTRAGDRLFFAGQHPTSGSELWTSDGTATGTTQVLDLWPGASGSSPAGPTALGSIVLFTATTPDAGRELWRSDGTAAGTWRVADLLPGEQGSEPEGLTALGGHVYFTARDSTRGRSLWRSDGSAAGTQRVADLPARPGTLRPGSLFASGNQLLLTVQDTATGVELWSSDGTEDGTALLKNIAPEHGASSPEELVEFRGTLFFSAVTPEGGRELWRSDGRAEGTVQVRDLIAGPTGSNPRHLRVLGDWLYFVAESRYAPAALWRSDGTALGTEQITLLRSYRSSEVQAQVAHERLYLLDGNSLWRSDGSVQGTSIVGTARASGKPALATLGSALVFRASSPVPGGTELYVLRAPDAVPELLARTCAPDCSSDPGDLVVADGVLYVAARVDSSGAGLFRSDGTAEGTRLVRHHLADGANVAPTELRAAGGRVFFQCPAPYTRWGLELCTSDGTHEGTVRLEPAPSAGPFSPALLAAVGSRMLFSASGVGGRELWVSDGTPSGTGPLVDLVPGPVSGLDWQPVSFLLEEEGLLAVAASDTSHGRELWLSDGTAQGTRLVMDVAPGAASSSPLALGRAGRFFFFSANDGSSGQELWALPLRPPAEDSTPPQVTCEGVVLEATAQTGAWLARSPASAVDDQDPLPLVRYNHDVLQPFALGTTRVTARASDANGNLAECEFSVTVQDTLRPTLTCPAEMFVEAESAAGSQVEQFPVSATDVATVPQVSFVPGAGLFPLGITPVRATATDGATEPVSCDFRVNVQDTLPPEFQCPWYVEVYATEPSGAHVSFDVSATDRVSEVTLELSHASGSLFPTGLTEVSARATDAAGNSDTCWILVSVLEPPEQPVLSCPAELHYEATSPEGAPVSLDGSVFAWGGTAPLAITYAPSPAVFLLGITEVVATVTDAAQQSATCHFPVRITDGEAPGVHCPERQQVELATAEGTAVTFVTSAEDLGMSLPTTASPPSGHVFPSGVTPVSVVAQDASGNEGQCSFEVEVVDTTPPELACPPDLHLLAAQAGDVAFAALAEDLSGAPTLRYVPEPGSSFPVGTTSPVEVTATDAAGNATRCSFQVVVAPEPPALVDSPAPIQPPAPAEAAVGAGCSSTPGSIGPLGVLLLLALSRRRHSRRA